MFSDPQHNIEQFMLGEGMHVADLGAGSGAYTLAAGRSVGSEGRVYAVEVQQELLTRIKNSLKAERVYNVEVIWGDLERLGGTRLRDFSMDAAIAGNVLFQLEEKGTFASEINRILKMKGKLLVVDWEGSFGGIGPSPQQVFPKTAARELFEKKGFVFEKEISAGDHHYGMIFRKK